VHWLVETHWVEPVSYQPSLSLQSRELHELLQDPQSAGHEEQVSAQLQTESPQVISSPQYEHSDDLFS